MENYIPATPPTHPENLATAHEAQAQVSTVRPSDRAADTLLQEMQLLLAQSRLVCEPDNAMNLGPNEKYRILCAMAEAITSGASTIAVQKRAPSKARNLRNMANHAQHTP
ncbi:MAG: hypothetical protein VB087_05935 [Candidatus Limiplasma sp.]|nr:hypothetical protein [Candidatus Limiplasma sp.]